METPKKAGSSPIKTELEANKKYYWCACGLSGNQPFCDGSHKSTDFRPREFSVDDTGEYYLCTCKQTGNAPFCDGTHKKI